MGKLAIDFMGFRYDEDDGSFINLAPGYLWHRPQKKIYDASSINKAMAAAKYTAGPNEIKRNDALIGREISQFNPAAAFAAGTPAVAVTAAATGTGTASVTITVAGGPAGAPGTVTITKIAVDGTAINDPAVVHYNAKATSDDIADKIQKAVDGEQDAAKKITVSAAVTGSVVTLTQAGATGAGHFDAGISVAVA